MDDDDRQLAELHLRERWTIDQMLKRMAEDVRRGRSLLKQLERERTEVNHENAEHCGR